MTTITINEAQRTVKVEGHADFAERGNDIVCAGVSALVWTLAGVLQARDALQCVANGDGSMIVTYREAPGVEYYLDMFGIGAELLSFKYPDNVRVQGRKSINQSDNMEMKGGVA